MNYFIAKKKMIFMSYLLIKFDSSFNTVLYKSQYDLLQG